jgi:hypothetical protein
MHVPHGTTGPPLSLPPSPPPLFSLPLSLSPPPVSIPFPNPCAILPNCSCSYAHLGFNEMHEYYWCKDYVCHLNGPLGSINLLQPEARMFCDLNLPKQPQSTFLGPSSSSCRKHQNNSSYIHNIIKFEQMREYCSSWSPSCIMIDACPAEIAAIRLALPNTQIFLCHWHVEKAFNKKLHEKVFNMHPLALQLLAYDCHN